MLFNCIHVAAQGIDTLYPARLNQRPGVQSPRAFQNGVETITVRMKNGQYSIVPVTVENDVPLDFHKHQYGRGRQLETDAKDFPELANTGLHDEERLKQIKAITGKPVDEITRIGRPSQSSGAGFMAEDEDILSVLIGDNRLAARLDLTHPQLAKPLFHMWNLVLAEYRHEGVQRFPCSQIEAILYNGQDVHIKGEGSRGFQESIFNDEILGNAKFDIWRDLTPQEQAFLEKHYTHLGAKDFEEMIEKLKYIHTSEMEPYYVMRYGFYEGHTLYRVDPVAIAFIFGLKNIEEIEHAFPGSLHQILTQHFSKEIVN
jgi:hypothetical protein